MLRYNLIQNSRHRFLLNLAIDYEILCPLLIKWQREIFRNINSFFVLYQVYCASLYITSKQNILKLILVRNFQCIDGDLII